MMELVQEVLEAPAKHRFVEESASAVETSR
jgi:hypothetical protein